MQKSNYPSGKDLLSAETVSLHDLEDVFARADRFWNEIRRDGLATHDDALPRSRQRPRVLATLFDQRSTRTRLGFQAAAARLGHQSLDVFDTDRSRIGNDAGESIEDHLKTIEA